MVIWTVDEVSLIQPLSVLMRSPLLKLTKVSNIGDVEYFTILYVQLFLFNLLLRAHMLYIYVNRSTYMLCLVVQDLLEGML